MTAPVYNRHGVTVHHGDSLQVLAQLADASVDSVVTDPPYSLSFMQRDWDSHDTSADFQAWCTDWARECLRVLKPGGWIASFGGTRTFHRLTCAIEDAGFEIRDSTAWVYGSGFPKSRNVTNDLLAMPPCTCRVGSEVADDRRGIVETGQPSGAIRARVGAEPGAVGFAELPANAARGSVPESGASSLRGFADMQRAVPPVGRDGYPVVLGSLDVAGRADGDEVVERVGPVEVKPEPLRDEMVSDQAIRGPAVCADPISGDDGVGDVHPAATLVLPLAAAPRRVPGSGVAVPVVDSHAGLGAVDAGVSPAPEAGAAHAADVDAVAAAPSHEDQSTPERRDFRRCQTCSGRIGEPPAGLGTSLKPAWEPIILARKPLSGTVAANVLEHGTGALNIDGCRVEHASTKTGGGWASHKREHTDGWDRPYVKGVESTVPSGQGRWPANILLLHAITCTVDPVWCDPSCPVAELDRQSGVLTSGRLDRSRITADNAIYGQAPQVRTGTYEPDAGGASRFFPVFRWEAKAPTSERPMVNGRAHPTVKPIALMRWLVRLITPPGGLVLDPFAGTGTTGQAARAEGMRALLIDADPEAIGWIKARLDARPRQHAPQPDAATATPEGPLDLLDLLDDEAAS